MLYVGLTEEHRESATMFANVVGSQVISQLRSSNSSMENAADNKLGQCVCVTIFANMHLLLRIFKYKPELESFFFFWGFFLHIFHYCIL